MPPLFLEEPVHWNESLSVCFFFWIHRILGHVIHLQILAKASLSAIPRFGLRYLEQVNKP